jgi:hypothetical protein
MLSPLVLRLEFRLQKSHSAGVSVCIVHRPGQLRKPCRWCSPPGFGFLGSTLGRHCVTRLHADTVEATLRPKGPRENEILP